MVLILKNASIDLLGYVGAVRHAETEEQPEWWSFDLVRDALVDAADLWWRTPGHGPSKYASDGPWRQMLRETRAGDYDARGGDGTSSEVELKPLPLTRAQVDRRDRISELLLLIPDSQDRRLVIIAVSYLARGRKRVPWRQIKRQMRIPFGEDGLRRRYERAVSAIAQALNTAEKRR